MALYLFKGFKLASFIRKRLRQDFYKRFSQLTKLNIIQYSQKGFTGLFTKLLPLRIYKANNLSRNINTKIIKDYTFKILNSILRILYLKTLSFQKMETDFIYIN